MRPLGLAYETARSGCMAAVSAVADASASSSASSASPDCRGDPDIEFLPCRLRLRDFGFRRAAALMITMVMILTALAQCTLFDELGSGKAKP